MRNVKRCFTINQHRTTEEFKTYEKLIQDNVFQAIEIFYPYDKNEEEQKTYAKNVLNLMKYNIEIVLHLPHGMRSDLGDEEQYEIVVQRLKDAIDFSKQFNINKYTLHLGSFKIHSKGRKYYFDKSVETIKTLCDYCYPGNIMIENMPADNELGYSPDEIKGIIEKSNRSNVKFILDFGHANVSEYPIEEYVNKLGMYLHHTHISNNDGTRDQHKPISQGNIDYKKVFKLLKDYNQLYCLEIIYHSDNDLLEYIKEFENVIE